MGALDIRSNAALEPEGKPTTAKLLDLRYGLNDRPGWLSTVLFGVQHVMIMFTAMVAAPLVIGQQLNLSPDLRTAMVTGVMFGCGIATIVSALGLWFVGGRLPLLLGAYAVYIGAVVSIAKESSLAAATSAMMIGGLALFALSPLVGRARALFPPVVIGTLLVVTGETLIRIAANLAVATGTPNAGRPVTLVLLVSSIFLIILYNRLTTGFLRSLAVFLTVITLYLLAFPLGLIDVTPVLTAPWFRVPHILPYGWFEWPSAGSILIALIYHCVAAFYTMSVTLALCEMLGVPSTQARVRGAVAVDGLGSAFAVLFGGVPLTSYDQNVGAISLTGVGSRFVVATAGGILVLMALLPKVAAVIAIAPPFILGGTLVFMFGMIVAIGISILSKAMTSQRDILVVAASVGAATAVNFMPAAVFEAITPSLRIVAGDGIVIGTLAAVLLNLVLPRETVRTA